MYTDIKELKFILIFGAICFAIFGTGISYQNHLDYEIKKYAMTNGYVQKIEDGRLIWVKIEKEKK
jgi:hypothetical protein